MRVPVLGLAIALAAPAAGPAQIPGVQVAGKTGTAETQVGKTINDAWFIAFAPSRDPRIAIAVNVQKVPGFGGEIAAPIARDVMAALLRKAG